MLKAGRSQEISSPTLKAVTRITNFGIAFDIGVFEGSQYLGESSKYQAVGVLGMDLGLEWGGNWKTIVD